MQKQEFFKLVGKGVFICAIQDVNTCPVNEMSSGRIPSYPGRSSFKSCSGRAIDRDSLQFRRAIPLANIFSSQVAGQARSYLH